MKSRNIQLSKDSIAILIRPYGDNKFACGIASPYELQTDDEKLCYAVAIGLCQIALDDPDLVVEIGSNTIELHKQDNKTTNGKDKIINFEDYRKKLH